MKNKTFYIALIVLTSLTLASCAARSKYGCPTTASIQNPSIEKTKI